MNMSPKVGRLRQKVPLVIGTSLLLLYKFLHLPRFILPRDFRAVVTNWEYEMFWVLLKSGFTRAYIDQPCYFKMPTSFVPKAKVAPQFQLSEKEIRTFYERGYLG